MSYLELFSRCLIALIFTVSAVGKVRGRARFRDFRRSLDGMRVLPPGLAGPVAGAVVAAEVAVPVLLAPWPSELPTRAGFALAVLLLGAFTAAIVAVLRRGTQAACRCFGSEGAPFGSRHVVRNVLLAACAAAGLSGTQPVTMRTAVVVPVAVLCAVLVARLDDLVALFSPTLPSHETPTLPVYETPTLPGHEAPTLPGYGVRGGRTRNDASARKAALPSD